MEVKSFTINHCRLLRGIYVSRVDEVGKEKITTFDVRIKEPNNEPVMDTSVMHTLEHLIAVFLRSHALWAQKTVYVGPMGCRTGMYIIFKGDLKPIDILPVMCEAFHYVLEYSGEVPAARPENCGNYLDHNLAMTQWESRKFLTEILENIKPENINYPD